MNSMTRALSAAIHAIAPNILGVACRSQWKTYSDSRHAAQDVSR